MWFELNVKNRDTYKRLILAYASLSHAFAQKEASPTDNDKSKILRPIVNSKFQEASFQFAFNAFAEDIKNTSFDVALKNIEAGNQEHKYLVGIKTFNFSGNDQKIAQFKKEHNEWNSLIQRMKTNVDGKFFSVDEINRINHDLYLTLARRISVLRNQRIKSSIANLQGFKVDLTYDRISYVYHVLMPSVEETKPVIYVGETDYAQINIDNIKIEGCTSANLPCNFLFSDGRHTYKFTPADSQLYMNFDPKHIIQETWDVVYVTDAYSFFLDLYDRVYGPSELFSVSVNKSGTTSIPEFLLKRNQITESYSWLIAPNGEVEKKSGFNNFYGTGMKLAKDQRKKRLAKLYNDYKNSVAAYQLNDLNVKLSDYSSDNKEIDKFALRDKIRSLADSIGDKNLCSEVNSIVFRPVDEMYIPIPDAKSFHNNHPDFFGKNIGTFLPEKPNKLALDKDKRKFILIFEPSQNAIQSYITQDSGKGIESTEKQSFLGNWLRKGVFQLGEFEPLTVKRLNELEINAIRLYKTKNKLYSYDKSLQGEEVHIEFIWIDEDNIPDDFIGKLPESESK